MLIPFFLSIDSFLIALGIGTLPLPSHRKYRTCVLFGLCDGVATLVGLHLQYGMALGMRSTKPWSTTAGIFVWILLVGFRAYRIAVKKRAGTLLISLLPVVMAIDNLLAGPLSSTASLPANIMPIATALFSTGLALTGFTIGALVKNLTSQTLATSLGFVLLCLTPILF
jgi:putative Mn2+ efflux pump MntP